MACSASERDIREQKQLIIIVNFLIKYFFSLINLLNIYLSGRSARMGILGILEMQSLLVIMEC
jgi:hypothetical protein